MPSLQQTQILKFQGGLSTAKSDLDFLQSPGFADVMTNFEGDIRGGYRRIEGYTPIGAVASTTPGAVSNSIFITAASPYFRGYVVARGGDVYYSTDGIAWVQVNKNTGDVFVDAATLAGLGSIPRTTTQFESYCFDYYHDGSDESLLFVDDTGVNPVGRLTIRDNSGTIEYKYLEASAADWGGTSRYPSTVTVLGDRVLYTADPMNKTAIYYSNLFAPFDLVGGGVVQVADETITVRSFRENAIVFCKNSIHKFQYIGDPTNESILPVTTQLGCVAAKSVQEVAGDLVFLAADGLRTIAGTDKIGDIELGGLSSEINQALFPLITRLSNYKVSSTVIRSRSNYRIFFFNKDVPTANQTGFGGVLKNSGNGLTWEWNTFSSLPVWDVSSKYNHLGQEETISVTRVVGEDKLFNHNSGKTFNGRPIDAVFRIPGIAFGDPEVRKTVYKVRVYTSSEGGVYNYGMKLEFDAEQNTTISPGIYSTENVTAPSLYNVGQYGASTYNGGGTLNNTFSVTGSGKAVDILFQSKGESFPFTIQGVAVTIKTNGRN